jgi:hypothetical protein
VTFGDVQTARRFNHPASARRFAPTRNAKTGRNAYRPDPDVTRPENLVSSNNFCARATLAAGFLSAVADRFPCGEARTNQVGWGNFETFTQHVQTLTPIPTRQMCHCRRLGGTVVEILLGGTLLLGVRIRWAALGSRCTGGVRRVDVHLRRLRDTLKCIGFHRCRSCATSRVGTARNLRHQASAICTIPELQNGHGEMNLIPPGINPFRSRGAARVLVEQCTIQSNMTARLQGAPHQVLKKDWGCRRIDSRK